MNSQPVLHGIIPCIHQGKVRDTYALPKFPDKRLIYVTDRVSTHNVLHDSMVPDKGAILLAMTLFWEKLLKETEGTYTHTVARGQDIYRYLPRPPRGYAYPADLHLRTIVVQTVDMFPYEFIYRGRMAGSLYKDYYSQGKANPYGLKLPEGMQLMDEFPQSIFTPTDKSETDEPVDPKTMKSLSRSDIMVPQGIYIFMRSYALKRGIDIIDTKLELGLHGGRRTLADEWGTPDSSRFVDVASIRQGEEPRWLDKQFLREEAEAIWKQEGRGKFPLVFSPQAIQETVNRYHEVVERLTGQSLAALQESLGLT